MSGSRPTSQISNWTMTGRRRFLMSALATSCVAGCATASSARDFSGIDRAVNAAITNHQTPGAVVVVGHAGSIAFKGVYGNRALVPAVEPMTFDTHFDMASLTKATMTAVCVMQFWEQGAFQLDDPVSHYLPDFAVNGKSKITIRHLLTHYSGLPPDVDLSTNWSGKGEAVKRAMNASLISPVGEKFIYSDINFITLGLLVEKFSGTTLDKYAKERVIAPLSMTRSGFLPSADLDPLIAPTQFDETGHMMRGVVHDPTARRMGGVAGHAGLFSDASDMSLYAQALLDRRAGRPSKFPLKPDTVVLMTSPQQPSGKTELRGLGWDIDTHYSSLRGSRFSKQSFGHTGFTGTSLWMDPVYDVYVLMLTNRVHPDGKGAVVTLRKQVSTEAALALGI